MAKPKATGNVTGTTGAGTGAPTSAANAMSMTATSPAPVPRSQPHASGPVVVSPGADARILASAAGLTETVAEILVRRGLTDPQQVTRYLDPRLSDLTRPDHMVDRAAAADRIARAVRSKERIAVFGDYDCDGITSTAILTGFLRELGAEVVPLLASRFEGGYGVTPSAGLRILESRASLLVTCDCGSTDHAVLADLKGKGLDVVVIDHHVVPEEPLPVVAFLNPHRPDCGFGFKGLTSCGLVLSLAAAIRAELGVNVDLRGLLDLVAIGTVADVAPLVQDNRILVRAGLERLRRAERPGIQALNQLARLGAEAFSAEDVAFRLAPRLNAPGRLGSPALALELLLARTSDEARLLAAKVEAVATERKAQQERMIAEAREDIAQSQWQERPAIVVGRSDWNHGIVGIVAGRLAAEFDRPVVAIGFDSHGVGRGSVRGPRGSRLHDMLVQVSPVLERFGGHQAAAGLEVRLERLDELREAFESACLAVPQDAAREEPLVTLLSAKDEPHRVVADLERLEPCGEGNPAPQLGVEALVLGTRVVRGGHLKLDLELADGSTISGFGANLGERSREFNGTVLISGQLRRDRWRGGSALEISVERILRGAGGVVGSVSRSERKTSAA